jgi:glycosyltransferase involved in cell wall biosynthesis
MSSIKTKKILCIGQLPPPVHGVSVMNGYIINSKLIKSNFFIEFIDLKFARSINELQKFSFLKIFKAIYYGYEIVGKVLTKKPDLVYFTICPTGFVFYRDAFYVFLLKVLNSKIVFHLHGKGIKNSAKKNFVKKYLYSLVFKNTNIICLTKRLSEDISEVYRSVPYIVPNGIEVNSKLNAIVNRFDRSIPRILFLSNYMRNKGILVLIEALGILHNQGYLFKARFVGAPLDISIEFLENNISKYNLAEVAEAIGPLYGDDKFIEFQNADIFVLPTYNDAFSLVNLEAMQYSLPVISTFEGSIPDIVVDNITGLLVENQNVQMLAEKIAILLKDKDLRIEMGKKGYERFINNYTLKHFENNLIRTFQAILSK